MLMDFLSSVLTKTQIQTFLNLPSENHEKKDLLAKRLWEHIEADMCEKQRLLDSYPLALAVGPSELERILQCTPAERRRWIQQGKIPVLALRAFQKAGSAKDYAIHDRRCVETIERETVALWRLEHRREVILHRQMGGQIASARRQMRLRVREQLLQRLEVYITDWEQLGKPDLTVVLLLSYWLLWVCSIVNTYAGKSHGGRKYLDEYIHQHDVWFRRKQEALTLLARTPYTRLAFFYPGELDQYVIWLCDEHDHVKKQRFYDELEVFFLDHRDLIEQCPRCFCERDPFRDAYYYLEVQPASIPQLCFAFHFPYERGNTIFPVPDSLPVAELQEMDGTLRFAQEQLNTQAGIFSEGEILTRFQDALARVDAFYPVS